jgi:hypothetical protein
MKQFTNARAYIQQDGIWRHVHVLRTYDQMTIEGGSVKMAEFKLSKNTKISYAAELSKFHKTAPKAYKLKSGLA